MDKLKVKIDGVDFDVEKGLDLREIIKANSPEVAKKTVAAKVDGVIKDLTCKLEKSADIEPVTTDSKEGMSVYWHSSSHILAQAVKRIYPEVKLGIGPSIENGFYYDFEFTQPISSEDLPLIEKEMQKIIKENIPLHRSEMKREESICRYEDNKECFKVELIEDLPDEDTISFYTQGDFADLCKGPHLPSTGYVKALKLTSLAGAYWRGSERNPMLQRIYGISFPGKQMLKDYLEMLEEAKKRDHRKLGRELDLFSLHEEGPGFPFFHPNGMIIWRQLENFWREEHAKAGYKEIKTPLLLNCDLWKRSGHWDHYQDNMYFSEIDENDFAIKPMNCPGAMLIYLSGMHSYRDLPLRIAELGQVHRHELSGTLHGLMRVRTFTQDDAHIFMLPEQIEDEVNGIIDMIDRFYSIFGFEYRIELSTRPEKAMGDIELWNKATDILQSVLKKRGGDFVINEGDGAFYGPKIDFHLRDSIGRTWQCGTIQLDFQMPEKFDLNYIGSDGQKKRPVMIHRVIYGAMERFFALLVEHYGGAFPAWLAPLQVMILPLTDHQHEVTENLEKQLLNEGFRVEVDKRSEKLGYKIRQAQLMKVPYMLVVGEKEAESGLVAVRSRSRGDLGAVTLDTFIADLKDEVVNKKI